MQFQDQIVLGPLEKYQKLNIPPYKAVVSLLLTIFTTIETLTIIHSNVHSNIHQIKSFTYLYFSPDIYDDEIFIESQHFHIRDNSDLIAQFQYMFDNLNSIDDTSFQHLSFQKATMQIYTYYETIDIEDSNVPITIVNISDGIILEPFNSTDPESIQKYLFNVTRFDIKITDIELNVSGINTLWTHIVSYEFEYSAELKIGLMFQTQKESDFSPQDVSGYYFRELSVFYTIVIILAVMEMYLNFKFFINLIVWLVEYSSELSRSRIKKDREIEGENGREWKEQPKYLYESLAQWMISNNVPLRKLSFEQWLSLFDFWNILSTIGNSCQIIGSVLLIFKFSGSGIIGLGCMISWLGIFKYLKYIPKFIILNSVLEKSIPQLFVFMAEFIPSFIAFMLFATVSFWKVQQFSSLMKTLNVQMCMMLGDSIELFTNEIADKRGKTLAMMYTFGFVLSFMHAIHNLITALIKQNFIRYKIDRARMKMETSGLTHKTSIQQLKPSYEQLKQTIHIDYSILYQNEMIRKQVKGIMDTTIYKVQRLSMAMNHFCKKLEDDFRRNLKYEDLSANETRELRTEIKDKLKSSQVRIEKLRAKVNQIQV